MDAFAPSTSVNISCPHIPHPVYPISWYDAEVQWDLTRRKMRADLENFPPFSFARTMFEADEVFYATFPQAKRAAIQKWFVDQFVNQHWAAPMSPSGLHKPSTTCTPYDDQPTQVDTFMKSQATFSGNAYPSAPCYSHLATDNQADTINNSTQTAPQQSKGHNISNLVDDLLDFHDISSPLKLELVKLPNYHRGQSQESNSDSKSSPSSLADEWEEPLSPTLSSCSDDTAPCSPSPSTRSKFSTPLFTQQPSFRLMQFTGDWEADAITAEAMVQAAKRSATTRPLLPALSLGSLDVSSPYPRRRYLHKRIARPDVDSLSTPCSPSSEDRQPTRKRGGRQMRDKNGKPLMACLFCRGRKIACRPPTLDGTATTCNQCARRKLVCKYPVENRRGMRRKKDDGVDYIIAADVKDSMGTKIKKSTGRRDPDLSSEDDSTDSEWEENNLKSLCYP